MGWAPGETEAKRRPGRGRALRVEQTPGRNEGPRGPSPPAGALHLREEGKSWNPCSASRAAEDEGLEVV